MDLVLLLLRPSGDFLFVIISTLELEIFCEDELSILLHLFIIYVSINLLMASAFILSLWAPLTLWHHIMLQPILYFPYSNHGITHFSEEFRGSLFISSVNVIWTRCFGVSSRLMYDSAFSGMIVITCSAFQLPKLCFWFLMGLYSLKIYLLLFQRYLGKLQS